MEEGGGVPSQGTRGSHSDGHEGWTTLLDIHVTAPTYPRSHTRLLTLPRGCPNLSSN
ncbi:uncharacterized protein G2W53_034576 [Senna tora]|uniref:Uncharacterized protein n=1 Tax=Senna tora TaxID=362788 RepID=A0A834T2W7_9FABA|nr:uncharacterized protein G2W53_034576 [Senna tora]